MVWCILWGGAKAGKCCSNSALVTSVTTNAVMSYKFPAVKPMKNLRIADVADLWVKI
jgi:hypothetical protein